MDSSRSAEVACVRFTPDYFREWLESIEEDVTSGVEEMKRRIREEAVSTAEKRIDGADIYRDHADLAEKVREDSAAYAESDIDRQVERMRPTWTVGMRDGETLNGQDVEALIDQDLGNSRSVTVWFRGVEDRKVSVVLSRRSRPRVATSGISSEWVRRQDADARRVLRDARPWYWWLYTSVVTLVLGAVVSVVGAMTVGFGLYLVGRPKIAEASFSTLWLAIAITLLALALLVVSLTTGQYRVATRLTARERTINTVRWTALAVIAGVIGALAGLFIRVPS